MKLNEYLKKLLDLIKGYEIQFMLLIIFIMFINISITNFIGIIGALFNGIAHLITEVINTLK